MRFYKMDSLFIGNAVVALMSSTPRMNCVTLFRPIPRAQVEKDMSSNDWITLEVRRLSMVELPHLVLSRLLGGMV